MVSARCFCPLLCSGKEDFEMANTIAPMQTGRAQSQAVTSGAGRPRPADGDQTGRWLSLLGGGALAVYGLGSGGFTGLALAAVGGSLSYGGARGLELEAKLGLKPGPQGFIEMEESTSILRSPEELYSFWRNFENLPRFMRYLDSVRTDGTRSQWVALGPLDTPVQWDAEIIEDRPNERIAWRSLPGSWVRTEGVVHFEPAPANRGTRVKVTMRYTPPGGKAGELAARLFGRSAEQVIREDLRRFKRLMETGEIPTTRGQPSGRGRDKWEQTASMVVQHRVADGLGWFGIGLGAALLLMPDTMAKLIGVRHHDTLLRLIGAHELASGLGILTQSEPTGWLWGRVAGDALDLSLLTSALQSPGNGRLRTAAALASVLGVTLLDLVASLQQTKELVR